MTDPHFNLDWFLSQLESKWNLPFVHWFFVEGDEKAVSLLAKIEKALA